MCSAPRYMNMGTFDEKNFPSSRAVLTKNFLKNVSHFMHRNFLSYQMSSEVPANEPYRELPDIHP